jgi:hypothetical protein
MKNILLGAATRALVYSFLCYLKTANVPLARPEGM